MFLNRPRDGDILRKAVEDGQCETTAEIVQVIALTGCRRSEVLVSAAQKSISRAVAYAWPIARRGHRCVRIGLPILEYLEGRRDEEQGAEDFVFPGWEDGTPFGSFPRQWTKLFKDTDLAGITPHVLRHSLASIATTVGSPRQP